MTSLIEKSVIKGLIRPKKVAFLLPYSISDDDFRELLSFIGTLWGGKYCCIIPFDSDGRNNDLGLSWLHQYQPDVILWLEGSCNDKWIEEIKDLTSPLNIRTIQLPLEENYRVNYTKIFHYWSVLEHYSTKIRSLPDTTTRFKFISTEKNIKNRIFYDLSFGATEKNDCIYLAELLRADSKHISEADIYDYIELQSNNKKPFTFLDASSIEVDTVNAFSQNTPTIFILSTSIVDYTWFWNQRAKFNVGACIAIPLDTLDDKVIKLLAVWLEGYQLGKASYCEIISISASKVELDTLARKLRPRVKEFGYEHVDVCIEDSNKIPVFGLQYKQYEIDANWLDKQSFEFMIPAPLFVGTVEDGSSGEWILEIEQGRNLKGHTPPKISMDTNTKILNVPSVISSSYMLNGAYSKRYSYSGIAIPCNKKKISQKITLPTLQEFLSPLFKGLEITYQKDEKELCYQSVIALFGGLQALKDCCKDVRYKILSSFWEDNVLPCEKNGFSLSKGCLLKRADAPIPVALGVIKGRAKLGNKYNKPFQEGNLETSYIEDPIILEAARARFKASEGFYRQLTPQSFIAWLVEMKAVRRVFQYPKCKSCENESDWGSLLDLRKAIFCSQCGSAVTMPEEKFEVAYQLNPLVYKAFEEGIRPVALTLAVLKRTSYDDFEYIAGFKGTHNEKGFDIDIIASCNGDLIFCECKTMENVDKSAKKWGEVKQQLLDLIQKAHLCGVKSVVLASLAKEYPKSVLDVVKEYSGTDFRVVLLNKDDLLRGHVERKKEKFPASFYEAFLPQVKKQKRRSGHRSISFGSMVESK